MVNGKEGGVEPALCVLVSQHLDLGREVRAETSSLLMHMGENLIPVPSCLVLVLFGLSQ